mmetsp:Transcript_72039/g.194168  ORF Transcript_72039/g.194168 Transcript_72039/m.194168 type:complete len:117 (-) Transcript_72039:254-604(-)
MVKKSDEFRKENNLNYGDEKLNEFCTAQCKCTVRPNPGFQCDIAETLLVGRARGEHKNLKDGDIIQPGRLGPDCTNNGYPGAAVDCSLQWQKDPVCTEATARMFMEGTGGCGCNVM